MNVITTSTRTSKCGNISRGLLFSVIFLFLTLFTSLASFSQLFNSSGTYTVPAGVTTVTVYVWGAGGGGGGGYNSCSAQGEGSGGGGGGFASSVVPVNPGQTYTVTVGTGGAAGAYNANGGAGGTSTFTGPGGTVTATGGGAGLGGGACGTVAGGSAGTGTVGTTLFPGGAGSAGIHTGTVATGVSGKGGGGAGSGSNGTTPNTSCPGTSGTGGTGSFPGGNGGVTANCGIGIDAIGQAGSPRGGGGSGGQGWTATTSTGGAGGGGQVLILAPCSTPAVQPTTLLLTTIASSQINGSFTAASGADSYLIVRYPTGNSPTSPSDGTTYSSGNSLGTGTVVGLVTSNSFNATGLTLSTTYDFYVYAANSTCLGGPNYLSASPLTGTASTPAFSGSTALGGLWSSPATWSTGAVPPAGENVVISAGAIVTIDQVINPNNLTVNGILQWNSTANAITATGNIIVGATGRFLAYTLSQASVTVNVAGSFTNNGFVNLAPSALNFNGNGSVLSGTGTFQGNGTSGIIRLIAFQDLGSNTVSTSQSLATTFGVVLSAGSLNTGGKIIIDNTAQVYGQPLNLQVANVVVTNMGSGYSTNAPVVFGVAVTKYPFTTALTLNTRYFAGTNVYLCTTAGTSGAANPTTTGNTPFADGTAQLLYLGNVGQLGLPYQTTGANTVGTQYAFQGVLYTALNAVTPTVAGAASLGATVGIVYTAGTAQMLCVGTAATVSINFDGSSQSVRSLNLTNSGNGYSSAPAMAFSNSGTTPTTAAAATAVYFQQVVGQVSSVMQKTQGTPITGGLTINSDQGTSVATSNIQASSGVGGISTANGGVNYSVIPTVGFAGPTAVNLVSNPGSVGSYTTTPTITVDATNLVSGTNLSSSSFTITMNQGQIVSVYLNASTTATYSAPPALTLSSALGGAALAWPSGCWPSATPLIGSNKQITNFTINSPGFGYVVAPTLGIGTTSGTALGGTFTTVASTPTSRIALYNLTLSFFTPATGVTTNSDDASFPTNRKLTNLTLGSNGGAGLVLSGNLTIYGTSASTAPLVLTASSVAPYNVIDLGGNSLNFTWNGFAGATGTFGASNTYIKNGAMSVIGRGGASNFNFPFSGQFNWFAGSTPTSVTTGSTVTKVTVRETGAPSGSGALGTRAFRVSNNGGIQGLNPTITMNWNSTDALTGNLQNLYISQSTALTGPWSPKSVASGTGPITATGTRTTATVSPGPIVPTGDDYFAWTSVTLNYSNVTVQPATCTATSHLVSADVISSVGTVTGVTITYNNGSSTGPVPMINTGGSTWQYTIPPASPSNALVTWSLVATNNFGITSSYTGTSYQDDLSNGVSGTASASVNPVCSGSPTILTGTFFGTIPPAPAASAYCPSTHISGCSGDNIARVVLNTLDNTTGTACGSPAASAYSNFSGLTGANTTTLTGNAGYNLSLTFGTDGNQYFGAWIDYNHDGAYSVSEFLGASGNAGGSGTIAVNFTVPTNAYNGITRMRIVGGNDVAVTSGQPCGASSSGFGETQDYDVTITGAASVAPYTGVFSSYSWSDGTTTVGTTNPLTVNPTVNTTYTLTAISPSGCPIVTSPVSLTINSLPPSPNPNNSTQCGLAVPGAFVTTGGGGGGFKWYSAQTGGTLLQNGGASYTSAISTTTHFWVSESNGTCESARAEVIATVTSPDAIQASANNSSPCLNTAISLSAANVASSPVNNYSYSWAALPAAGSGLSGSTPGNPLSVTPTTSGTFTYTVTGVDGTCTTTSDVVIIVKALPVITSATATPSTICAGTTVTLNGKTTVVTTGSVTVGTATTTIQSGSPFRAGGASDTKTELLYTASELSAAGIVAGNITSMTFNFTAASGGTLPNFTIKMGATALTALSATFATPPAAVVYGPASLNPPTTTGLYTITFSTPFNWNGTSNILIDFCHDLPLGSAGSGSVDANTTAFLSNSQVLITSACTATTGGTTQSLRPVIKFGAQSGSTGPGTYSWIWNPGNLSGATVSVTPSTTTVYTVTATDPATTCVNTANVTVNVNPLPPLPSGADGTDQCGTGLTDASVSSNNTIDPQSPPFFKWYSAATGGTLLQSGSSTTYTTAIASTTNFYVSEVSTNGCEGPRVHFTTIVSDPDVLSVTVSVSPVCLGTSTNISSAYTPSFNSYATFDLTATGGAASGVSGTVSLTANTTGSDPYTITPTAAGTYTYTITAYDPDKGCTSIGSVTVTVKPLPVLPTNITATPPTICNGQSSVLKAQAAGSQTPPSYTLPGTTSNGLGDEIRLVSFGTINNVTAAGGTNGYVDYTSIAAPTVNSGNSYNFSVSVADGGGSEFAAVWFDFNRNGIYEASEFYSVPLILGTTYDGTISVLIPANAPAGVTGMRVRSKYSVALTSGDAYTAYTYGETEEYRVNIIGSVDPTYVVTWNPGNLSGATVTVNPASTTVYTLTVTANGCSISSAGTQVTVNPLPAAPATNSPVTRCGPGPVTLTATSAGGTLIWYDAATAGNLLQTGGNSYTPGVTANTSFYVSETSAAGCEGPRSQITVAVTPSPSLVINPNGVTTFCLGGSVGLNTSPGTDPSYTNFSWSSSPLTGGGLSSSSGASVTATPTVSGSIVYTVVADDGNPNGCQNSQTITLIVNSLPVITAATANPATSCPSGAVTLTATTPAIGPGLSSSIGTGTATTSTMGITPFGSNYEGARVQYLIRASELTAAGLTPGNLTSLAFDVTASGGGPFNQEGFTIKIANTAQSALPNTYGTPTGAFTQVLNPTSVEAPTVGMRTFTFDTPYSWDGTSNLLVDICHDNDISATCPSCYSASSTVKYSVTSYNSVYGSYADNAQSCGVTAALTTFTFNNRPNIVFGGQVQSTGTGGLNWVWNPGNVMGAVVTVNPIASTTYTVTATNPSTTCSNTATVLVTVVAVTANATAAPSTPVCAGTLVTLSSGGSGGGTLSYSWASTPAGSYPATSSISVSPTVTTSYTVTVTDACGNPTTSSVSVTVNPLPTASIQEGPGPLVLCSPATQTLTAVTDAASASYQWTLNGSNIAGATSSTYTVSTVSSGMYRVIITNTATNCVSVPSAPVSVTINPQPAAVTITPAISTICNGGSQSLTASGGTTGGSGTATIGTATTLTGAITQPTAFCNRWPSYRMQTLYTAAELTAAGLSAGNINSMSFNISTLGDGATNANFVVKVGTSALTVLSGDFVSTTSFTTVYPSQTYTHAVGVNVIPFTTPFVWNGTSNIIVEVIHSGADLTNNSQTYYTATTGNMVAYTITASTNAASFSTQRLNVAFGYSSLQNPTWSWLPVTGLNTTNGATVIASPAVTTTYTATSTNSFGCTNSNTAVVNVNPRPTAVISGTGTYCQGTPTATNLTINFTGTAPWSYTYSDGTTPVSGTTSSNPLTLIVSPNNTNAGTTTYTVTALSDANCTAIAADLTGSATVTVNPTPATPTVTPAGPVTICSVDGPVVLTSSAATGNQWYMDGNIITGETGTTLNVTASAAIP